MRNQTLVKQSSSFILCYFTSWMVFSFAIDNLCQKTGDDFQKGIRKKNDFNN